MINLHGRKIGISGNPANVRNGEAVKLTPRRKYAPSPNRTVTDQGKRKLHVEWFIKNVLAMRHKMDSEA